LLILQGDNESGYASMSQIKNILMTFRTMVAGLLLCLGPGIAVHAADDYLSAVEAEADDTGTASEPVSSAAVSPEKKTRHVSADKVIEPGLNFDEFEEILDARYSGSNSLYVRLSRGKRRNVYKLYQNDNRISSVREEIVRLLSSG
jgi:hypothetical protein